MKIYSKTAAIALILLLLAGGAGILLVASNFLTGYIRGQHENYFINLAGSFSRNVASAVVSKDTYSLNMFIRDISMSPGVLYVAISNEEGRVIAQSDAAIVNKLSDAPVTGWNVLSRDVLARRTSLNGEKVTDISVPLNIMDEYWGMIRIGVSDAGVEKNLVVLRIIIIVFGVSMLLITLSYVSLFPNTIIIPILKFVFDGATGEEKRKFTRILVNKDVDFNTTSGITGKGKLTDLSTSGAKLSVDDDIQPGEKVTLSLSLTGNENKKWMPSCSIQWRTLKGGINTYGIQFDHVNLIERMQITEFLNRMRVQQDEWIKEKLAIK
ncbi:MAG: PilZ domain-containing protein [Elusimicrobia bacterium]|nr:PilZ domain-containing protein [Elusimicrobiota bacterium]